MTTSIRPIHLTLLAGLGLAVGLAGCASTGANSPMAAAPPVPMFLPPTATAAQTAETSRDEGLLRLVKNAFAASPSLDAAKPVILVYQSNVYLSGTVRAASDKDLAASLARGVPGVTGITNNLVVRSVADENSETADDLRITRLVTEAFAADPAIRSLGARIATFKRVVYLSGTVASAEDRARADRLARTIPGVVDVTNNIGPKS